MRISTITMIVLAFSLISSLMQATGALPYVNSAGISSFNQTSLNQLTASQDITSNDATGSLGWFNFTLQIVTTLISVMITMPVAIALLLCNISGWNPVMVMIAAAVQVLLDAYIAFELLYIVRGITP